MLKQELPIVTAADLESLACRLTDLPKYCASASKKDRKYAEIVIRQVIVPFINRMIDGQAQIPNMIDVYDIVERWGKYYDALVAGQYKDAEKQALDWIHSIRRETKPFPD